MGTLRKLTAHRTHLIFASALVFSLLGLGLPVVVSPWLLPVTLGSIGFNIGTVVISDRHGFVRSKEMRRAHEPARHFSSTQVFVLIALAMVQLLLGLYLLLQSGAPG